MQKVDCCRGFAVEECKLQNFGVWFDTPRRAKSSWAAFLTEATNGGGMAGDGGGGGGVISESYTHGARFLTRV